MSDHSISIVPRVSNYSNKEQKVKEVLAWLVKEDVVQEKKKSLYFEF